MQPPRIALCALVKDITTSKHEFPRTLENLLPIISEAVIAVSNQSTDNSREILEHYATTMNIPVQIYTYEWQDDFSDALNNLFDRAKSDWNLRLHQDRRLRKDAIEIIPDLHAPPGLRRGTLQGTGRCQPIPGSFPTVDT